MNSAGNIWLDRVLQRGQAWDIVHKLRDGKRRRTKTGYKSIFAGILFCADCKSKLYFVSGDSIKTEQFHFICAKYRKKGKDNCSIHSINEKVLCEIVLEEIRRVTEFARERTEEFAEYINKSSETQLKKELKDKQKLLDKHKKRLTEVSTIFRKKQIEDLISDLTIEFLKNWKPEHDTTVTGEYDPYYMGEVVLSVKPGNVNSVIDGQQRITTFTLLLMYIIKRFENTPDFPKSDMERLVYKNERGAWKFTLGIDERNKCMKVLYEKGSYSPPDGENMSVSIKNLVDRYNDIGECWDDRINESNINCFVYWLMGNVMFSKVWTNSDEFAYVIFETMNDRGLSLTQIEMLRSYLLANIKDEERQNSMDFYDQVISELAAVKLSSKSKSEFEFFKIFFKGHYADNLSQSADSNSDFIVIGQQFHRWVRDKSKDLDLNTSGDYVDFINKIAFFARKYIYIMKKIENRKDSVTDYLYLIVNSDYGFTLQSALLLSAISYNDTDAIVDEKIKIVSKYLTKVLSWRVWRHTSTAQSSMEDKIYKLCKQLRGKNIDEIKEILATEPIKIPELSTPPTLNMMNKPKIRVLLSLITEIVARESNESDYMLNKENIEVEHIWADHYEWFSEIFPNEADFNTYRNNIGSLLVLPKSFNASYGDMKYKDKVELYFSQNILAHSLCEKKYTNSPGFKNFIEKSSLDIHAYDDYTCDSITERAELYRQILLWNWK